MPILTTSLMAAPVTPLDLAAIGNLTFEAPDAERFPALGLAVNALRSGGNAPIVLNAANEVAVDAFLGGQIGFLDIAPVVEGALEQAASRLGGSDILAIDEVLEIDLAARHLALETLQSA